MKNTNTTNNNNNKDLCKNNQKSYLQRLILGIKHAFKITSLPDKVLRLHNCIYTRLFRVFGGLSIVAHLSGVARSYLYMSGVL